MTKKSIKHGTIQKLYYLHNGICHTIQLFIALCQFYSRNYKMREKKYFAVSAYSVMSKEVKNQILIRNEIHAV